MQQPDRTRILIRLPLILPLAMACVTFVVVAKGTRWQWSNVSAEPEIAVVSRLQRLATAVMARDAAAIAPLLDDRFTDERGREKKQAIAAMTASGRTPLLGYRPDREVYTLSPDGRSITAKNTVRLFTTNPKTRRLSAQDVTVTTDWVLTDKGWLLYRARRPAKAAVRFSQLLRKMRAS